MSQYDFMKNLDHCWVCHETSSLHEHHIIPQAYGGVDGPTVTLCATCHNGVHHVADGRIEMQPTSWNEGDRDTRGKWLVNAIIQARIVASKSANKRVIVTLELSANEATMLDRIKQSTGSNSRVNTLKDLIKLTYQRLTIR